MRHVVRDGKKVTEMSTRELEELDEYSCSLPTGTTFGKRWRKNASFGIEKPPVWWLGYYFDDNTPGMVAIGWRKIELTEQSGEGES